MLMKLVAKITLQRFDEHAEYSRVITIEEDADSQWRYSVNVHKGKHSLPSLPAGMATSETKTEGPYKFINLAEARVCFEQQINTALFHEFEQLR
jgi:hypothetical protein